MSVKNSFDNELAVASVPLTDWAPPLVEHLGRYFEVSEGILQLDYAHLSAENTSNTSSWLGITLTGCENFTLEFEYAARLGPIGLTLSILGHGSTGIKGSSSILDEKAYGSAEEAFRKDVLQGDSRALRETIMAAIAPREIWMGCLLDAHSSDRSLWCCEAFAEDRDKGLAHEFERADAVLFRFKIRTRFWVIVERDVG
ncbi:hypothetical protein ACI2KS_18570 [Pseudomonas sp. NPDC087358]|uniref:hypothetical protein n=1 Tax=Pseudomonas sp. NPDC087358 TaxID=3364439 RepID=UPI00384C7434